MSSVSSTSSVSSSSLGNTALKGFGGLASGIERDELIEQMTLATQTKITKAEADGTKLEWKQEAYRSISDKVLDIQDNYLSFTSSKSVKYASTYEKNVLTATGDENATKFIKASGASDMVDYLQIKGVTQLATSASIVSAVKSDGNDTITTNSILKGTNDFPTSNNAGDVYKYLFGKKNTDGTTNTNPSASAMTSNLRGKTLSFGEKLNQNSTTTFKTNGTFTFYDNYTDDNGNTVDIDYTADAGELAGQLNKMVEKRGIKVGDATITFSTSNGGLTFTLSRDNGSPEGLGNIDASSVNKDTLKALGLANDSTGDVVDISRNNYSATIPNSNLHNKVGMLSYLADNKVTMTLDGTTKTFNLLTQDDINVIANTNEQKMNTGYTSYDSIKNKVQELINTNIKKQFGSEKFEASIGDDGKLTFSMKGDYTDSTLTITSSDALLRSNLGITKNESNKLSMNATLWDSREKLGLTGYSDTDQNAITRFNEALENMTINGEKIINSANNQPLNSNSTISEMLSAINNSKAGVKAMYLSGSNQFTLIASETGAGRNIDLSGAAGTIFGAKAKIENGQVVTDDDGNTVYEDGSVNKGQDAELVYDFGTGGYQTLKSSTNTFNLNGMSITASGTFGAERDSSGNITNIDTSKTVRFSAAADTDKIVERVKSFIEDYNTMLKEVHKQQTTKPSSGYDPLTDAQKKEMSETSIKNWEDKAKEGILYSESVIRDMGNSLSGVLNKLIANLDSMGLSYQDLENMGISTSSDIYDGGTITFDEDKFKTAVENNPDKVSKVMAGSNGVSGLAQIVEDTLTPYATRYATRNNNSYGKLIEQAGSTKLSLSLEKNTIYKAIQTNKEEVERLKKLLSTEQDRYINQFTMLETAISQLNSQSSYMNSMLA